MIGKILSPISMNKNAPRRTTTGFPESRLRYAHKCVKNVSREPLSVTYVSRVHGGRYRFQRGTPMQRAYPSLSRHRLWPFSFEGGGEWSKAGTECNVPPLYRFTGLSLSFLPCLTTSTTILFQLPFCHRPSTPVWWDSVISVFRSQTCNTKLHVHASVKSPIQWAGNRGRVTRSGNVVASFSGFTITLHPLRNEYLHRST